LRISFKEPANVTTKSKGLMNRRRNTMRNKIWTLIAMACLAIVPIATAHAQRWPDDYERGIKPAGAASTAGATAGVMNTIPSGTVPMAVSNAAARSVGDQSGIKERSTRQTVKCTYAYSQAYGSCPKVDADSCSYAQSQAYGSCPKGQ
jgi:hypothetical protein